MPVKFLTLLSDFSLVNEDYHAFDVNHGSHAVESESVLCRRLQCTGVAECVSSS